MAKTTLFYYARSDDSNDGTFLTMGNASHLVVGNATEAPMQAIIGAAGTLSDLFARVAAGGSSSAVTVRNGAADTLITVVPTGAGEFTDNVNTDAVAANDKINFGITVAALTPEYFSCVFDADDDTVFVLNAIDNTGDNVIGTDWMLVVSAVFASNSAHVAAHTLRSAGTIVRAYCYINSSSGTATYKVAINGTVTAQAITTTSSTTGLFEYTGAAVSYSAGDTIQWEIVETAGQTNHFSFGVTCISTNSKQDCIGRMVGARTASATVHYWPIAGEEVDDNTDEERIKHSMQYDGTASNLRIHSNTNTYTGNGTFTLRKNGVDTAVTLSHTAASTSLIEDTTNTVAFVAGDDLSLSYTGGTSGTLGTGTTYALTIEADVAGAPTPITISATATGTASFSKVKQALRTIAVTATGTALIGKGQLFLRTIAASATGTAVLSFIRVFPRNISASAIGTAVISKIKIAPRTISASATGTAVLSKAMSLGRIIAATAVGTAVISKVKGASKTISANAIGTVALVKVKLHSATISVTATGTALFSKALAAARTISVTATGTAVLAKVKMAPRTIAATAVGTAAITKIHTFLRTISASAVGTAVITKAISAGRTISVTATGTASILKAVTKTIAASATGTAVISKAVITVKTISAVAVGTAAITFSTIFAIVISVTAVGTALVRQAKLIFLDVVMKLKDFFNRETPLSDADINSKMPLDDEVNKKMKLED